MGDFSVFCLFCQYRTNEIKFLSALQIRCLRTQRIQRTFVQILSVIPAKAGIHFPDQTPHTIFPITKLPNLSCPPRLSFLRRQESTSLTKPLIQIFPIRILLLNQINLPLPVPFLYLLFPHNRCTHIICCLKPN